MQLYTVRNAKKITKYCVFDYRKYTYDVKQFNNALDYIVLSTHMYVINI